MNEIFSAVDLASISLWVFNIGVFLVGIYMAFKAIDLGKRAIYLCGDQYKSDREWMEKHIDRVDDDNGYYSKDADGYWSHKND